MKDIPLHRKVMLVLFILLLVGLAASFFWFLIDVGGTKVHAQSHIQKHPAFTVCVDTGLTGKALQENTLFCHLDGITNTVLDCCGSVYQQAIHLAQQKGIIVGYPLAVIQSVDWRGRAITYVPFSKGGYYGWHYNPSNGIATIDDINDHAVYSGR